MGRAARMAVIVLLCLAAVAGLARSGQTFTAPTTVLSGLAQPRETAVAPNGDLYFTQSTAQLVTLWRLPTKGTKPSTVYRLGGVRPTLSDIHFDDAGRLLFVTLVETQSGNASTLTRLDPGTGKATVLAKASGGEKPGTPGLASGSEIGLDGLDDSGTVYFTLLSIDPNLGAQTMELRAIDPGTSAPSSGGLVTYFSAYGHADRISFMNVTPTSGIYFTEKPRASGGATLYHLTDRRAARCYRGTDCARVLLRGAALGARFGVAAAAFDSLGNLYVLQQRFSGFVRVGCASTTTVRVSRVTATGLAVAGKPAFETVGEATYDGYVGLWPGASATWPGSSAYFRVSDAGDVYWAQSPLQSQCGSGGPHGRLSDQLVGLAAGEKTPRILYNEGGPFAGETGCCAQGPMGIATDASGVFLAVADKLLHFGSASQPPPPPMGAATGNVVVDGEPFVGGVVKYGWTIDVSSGTLNLNTDVGELTIYGAPGTTSRLMMARPNASQLDLDLIGGDFSVCGKQRTLSADDKKKKKKVRLLWAKGKGKFRSAGRDSIASVHGTTWLTEDRCDGTLTAVKEGVVSVRDLHRRKTVSVRAGRSYLARHRASR